MARYFPPPEEYRPGLILQLRQRLEGGGLRDNVLQIPQMERDPRRRVVVLVHGFNNHYGEAAMAYQGFRRRQYDNDKEFPPPTLERLLGDVFWPGDAAWGIADIVDFLVYPVAVGTARDAAPILADHLRNMPNLLLVHFIGHSLGCRVTLEAIEDLRRNGGPPVGKVCLMAAAVPIFMVERGGNLADAISYAENVLVLYSERDLVLKLAFRAGQTVARGYEGFFPIALGARRPPPTVAGYVNSIDIDGAGHSDYWGHMQGGVSGVASARAGEFFQFGTLVRTIDSRDVAVPASTPQSRPESAGARVVGS